MKKYRNILVLFLATIVFFVGAGVTVVDLCCSGCIDKVMSIELQTEDCSMAEMKTESPSCCSQKDYPVDHSSAVASCTGEHANKCCDVKRVSMDLDYSVYQSNLLCSMVWTIVPAFISNHLLTSDNNESLIIGEARAPIPIPPRNYLSLLRVLII